MHELGITRNVVAIVAEQAQGRAVSRVVLQVGRLSGVLPDAIRFCFDLCARGTVLEGAALQIVETPGRGLCEACGASPTLDAPRGRCPDCGQPTLRLASGDELKIIEMETASCV